MSLNPLAPATLPDYQLRSHPPISLCNSTAISLPLAQIFCRMPPLITPSHALFLRQPIIDDTFIHSLIQPENTTKQYTEPLQPPLGLSSLLPSHLQHQAQCVQAIHKTMQQFHQHLKAEQLDRKTSELSVLKLQNDFALLRYLLFSSVGTILVTDISNKNSATSPSINPNLNVNRIPHAFRLPFAAEPPVRRSTLEGAVGPPRAKTNNSAKADFQSSPNTRETPLTQAQHSTSKISKREKLFEDETATYTSNTAGIHSKYFFLYDETRQLEPGNSDVIIWKIPSVTFVFDSAKIARPSSDPLIELATSFSSPIFRTHLHGYNFFNKFYPYGIGPATGKCASVLITIFPGDYDNLLQRPFWKLIHIGISDQLDPLNTGTKTIQPDQNPAYKKPTNSTKKEFRQSSLMILFLALNSLAKLKVF